MADAMACNVEALGMALSQKARKSWIEVRFIRFECGYSPLILKDSEKFHHVTKVSKSSEFTETIHH